MFRFRIILYIYFKFILHFVKYIHTNIRHLYFCKLLIVCVFYSLSILYGVNKTIKDLNYKNLKKLVTLNSIWFYSDLLSQTYT